jgi:hypothetical protein
MEKNIGYEVAVKVPKREKPVVYCVDGYGIVRGWYEEGARYLLGDRELWTDEEGIATMKGNIKEGGLVSVLKPKVKIAAPPTGRRLRVVKVEEINIGKILGIHS